MLSQEFATEYFHKVRFLRPKFITADTKGQTGHTLSPTSGYYKNTLALLEKT